MAGAPPGISGDRKSPVPAGKIANIGGGWRMQVLDVVPDAAAQIKANNEFNDPPPTGSTFMLVKVALGYFGKDDPHPSFEPTISAVGSASVELDNSCGTIPGALDQFADLFAGGVVSGNLCFVVTPGDTVAMYAQGDFTSSSQVFLSVGTGPTGATPLASLQGPQPGATSTPARSAPVALGTATDVGEGWTFTVNSAARDITDQVVAQGSGNAAPPDGYRYIGVDVTFAYNGADSASAFEVGTRAVGAGNRELTGDCGIVPGAVDESSDLFAGGKVTGTICFVAPTGSPGFVLYSNGGLANDTVKFLAVS